MIQTPQVEEKSMDTPATEPSLTARDRCDRCGAQAYVKTRHPLGRHPDEGPQTVDLLWCAHHTQVHIDRLREFVVLDEREKLDVRPVASY